MHAQLYLVDFGLSDWYVDDNGEHIPQQETE
jgi:hypothetical protein